MTEITFKHRVEYVVARGGIWVLNLLPEWLAYGAIGGIGRLYFRCSKRRQGYALRLMHNAFPGKPDAELLPIARRATGNLFKVSLDMVRVGWWIKRGRFEERVDLSQVRERMPEPPFIGITPHIGNWEVGAIGMGLCTEQAHAITRVIKNPLLQRFMAASRESCGLFVHPRRGGFRGLARALASGYVGLQAIDQNQRLRGIFVPFFGEPASTERSAATLAVRKGYPIVLGRCLRIGSGFRFRFELSHPFYPEITGDVERDVFEFVSKMNKILEETILLYPDQYIWIHDRYRTRPSTDPDSPTGSVESRVREERPHAG